MAAPGSNGERAAKNLIHHGDTEGTEEKRFGLRPKKNGQFSVISVPLTSVSEWGVQNLYSPRRHGEHGGKHPLPCHSERSEESAVGQYGREAVAMAKRSLAALGMTAWRLALGMTTWRLALGMTAGDGRRFGNFQPASCSSQSMTDNVWIQPGISRPG